MLRVGKKFQISIITLIIIAIIVISGISQMWFTKHGKSILEDYAKRPTEETVSDLVYIGENSVALAMAPTGDTKTATVAKAAFVKVNEEREAEGLKALKWSDELNKAAGIRAQEVSGKWSHKRPDGSDYWTVDSNAVYGENISKGFRTAEAAYNSWMESESHRTNLMDEDYGSVSIFVYEAQDGNWYWVTEFGA